MHRWAKVVVSAVLVASVAAAGCSRVPDEAKKRSYVDKANHFAFNVPDGWVQADNTMGATVAFLAPEPVGEFTPNLNVVVVQSMASNLEDLKTKTDEMIVKVFNGYRELSGAIVDHPSGRKALTSIYEHSMLPRPVRVRYCAFLIGGKEYGMTVSVPAEVGDEWADRMKAMTDSFIAW